MTEADEIAWVARLLWLEAGMPAGGAAAFQEEACRLLGHQLPYNGHLRERERAPRGVPAVASFSIAVG